jgi:hypothetical protein
MAAQVTRARLEAGAGKPAPEVDLTADSSGDEGQQQQQQGQQQARSDGERPGERAWGAAMPRRDACGRRG